MTKFFEINALELGTGDITTSGVALRRVESLSPDEVFRPGKGVYLFWAERPEGTRMTAVIRELDADGLDLSVDAADAREARLAAGVEIRIGFGLPGQDMYYGSAARIIETSPSFDVIRVSRPTTIKKWPRRRFRRGVVSYPWRMEPEDSNTPPLQGKTKNISASGALLVLSQPQERSTPSLKLGARGRLTLELPKRPPVVCGYEVVRQAVDADGQVIGVAVHYKGIAEVHSMLLQLLALRATARRLLRTAAKLPCRLSLSKGRAEHQAVTINISATGMLLELVEELPCEVGDRGQVHLSLPDEVVVIPFFQVVRIERRATGRARIAVNYGQLDDHTRQTLLRFVLHRIHGRPTDQERADRV